MKARMILIPILILSLMSFGVVGLLTVTFQIENFATMVAIDIGVYWDVTTTKVCDSINWETLEPGENKTITVYVKNTGGDSITGSFTVQDFDPLLASAYISLEWNFGNEPLLPGRVRRTKFTLRVSKDIHDIENFYFKIVVTGTQYIG